MNLLDELRKKVLGDDDASDEAMALCNRMLNWLDAFEAAHPGLKDTTWICPRCGQPRAGNRYLKHGRVVRGYSSNGWYPPESVCLQCHNEKPARAKEVTP